MTGQRHRPLEGRAVLRRVAADGDDRDPARSRSGDPAGRDVELRVVDADVAEAVGAPVESVDVTTSPVAAATNVTPSAVAMATRGSVLDGQAGETAVGDRLVDVGLLVDAADPGDDRRLGGGAEAGLVGRGVAAEQVGEDTQPRPRGPRPRPASADTRRPAATGRKPGDPDQVDRADLLGRGRVERREPVVVGRHEQRPAVVGRVHLSDRPVDLAEGLRTADEPGRLEACDAVERVHVEREDLAVRRPDEQRWRTGSIVSATAPGTAAAKTGSRVPRS